MLRKRPLRAGTLQPSAMECNMSLVSNAARQASPNEPAATPHSSSAPAALLRFAHISLSAALRHDYFSNGKGHQQSKAVLSAKPAKPPRKPPLPSLVQADEPHADRAADGMAELADGPDTRLDDAALPPHTDADPASTGLRASDAGPDLAARYLAEIAQRRRLTSSEEYHLASRAGDGDLQARHRLIEHHLGLVVMMARRYANRGLPLLDLIEEGNLGLITASSKFDPELGFRFSTYAKWWIRQGIELALMTQSRLVRLPIHLSRSVKQAARQQAQKRSGGTDAAAATGDPMAGLGPDLLALLDHDDREGGALIDELPADEDTSPEAHLSQGQRRVQLGRMLNELSDKERRVIEGRYALRQPEARTLDDIARELKLSCERVRQIEKEALYKLRRLFDDHGIAVDTLL
jgi:RNA polymerase nonessential primary-like sigma factor